MPSRRLSALRMPALQAFVLPGALQGRCSSLSRVRREQAQPGRPQLYDQCSLVLRAATDTRFSGPLCNTPVAVHQGQDPNVRMDFHLERECSVVTGKVRAKTTPLCASATCKKVLFSPIRCTVGYLQHVRKPLINLYLYLLVLQAAILSRSPLSWGSHLFRGSSKA